MSRQGGFKQGMQSNAQKEESARDLLSDVNPKGSPVAGAFGSKQEVVEGNHLDVNEDQEQETSGRKRYE